MSGSIGGIDASIPLQVGKGVPAPANPLEMLGNFANIQNALNRNKLFPGEQELQAQSIEKGGIGNKNLTNQTVYTRLTPLLALPEGGITHSNLTSMLASVERNGGLPTNGVLQHIMEAGPKGDGPEFDKFIRSMVATQSQSPEGALRAVAPVASTMNNGQEIIPGTVDASFGAKPGAFRPAGAPIQTFLTPQNLATQVEVPYTAEELAKYGLPPGSKKTIAMADLLNQQGAGALSGKFGQILSGNQQPASPDNPPRINQVPGQSPQPPATAGTLNNVQPGLRGVPASTPLGLPEEAKAATEAYNTANALGNTYLQRINPLKEAQKALKSTNTGPGMAEVNKIKSFLLTQLPNGIAGLVPKEEIEKITTFDKAAKYLAQYALLQPGGARSDMSLGLTQAANASTAISNKAAIEVVANALGVENLQQAAIREFNRIYPAGNGANYSRWLQTEFIPNHDPRGFSWWDQTKEQQDASLKDMKPNEKLRLRKSVELATKLGLTENPNGR